MGNFIKSFFLVCPMTTISNGFAIRGERLKLTKTRNVVPLSGPQNNRNDACFASPLSLQGLGHFDAIAGVRIDKVWTYQQKDQVSSFKLLLPFLFLYFSRSDIVPVPYTDSTCSAEKG